MSALTVALLAAQAELPTALGRDAANETAGYRYMTLDALDHIESDLDDGALVSVMPLYLSEPKNMQSLGAAITYARRYSWASALGIAAEEDTDAATMPEEDIPF